MRGEQVTECERNILNRLAAAGPAGLTTGGLLPNEKAGTRKGKVCRDVLKRLLHNGDVGNLGSAKQPCYVAGEHFKPLETAYEHIENRARESGVRLGSKSSLSKGLRGAVEKRVDEALKLLVAEGVLIRLKWAGKPVYLHASALPRSRPEASNESMVETATREHEIPDDAAIQRAYRETVNEFGYPDVLIHEIFLRLGGELQPFKDALMEACRSGRAVASVGDWSLSTPEERKAAVYINGRPHLRIRFKR